MMAGIVRRLTPAFARVALIALVAAGALLATMDPYALVNFLTYGAIGALLVIRRPRHAVGWLLLGLAALTLGTSTWPELDGNGLRAGTAPLADSLIVWFGGWAGGMSFLTYALLAIVFPSGRFPSGRRRTAAIALIGVGLGVMALTAVAPIAFFTPEGSADPVVIPNRFALFPPSDFWSGDALPIVVTAIPILILAIAVASLIVRYRRATGILRLQFRWLVAAVTFVIAAVVFGLVVVIVGGGNNGAGWIPAIVAYPTVPLAIGIAITRYRLYEIDRIISRTIGYGLVTATLFAVFGAVNIGLQGLLNAATGNEPLVVAGSTLLVAALFNPLRIRVQRVVDRRFNRARYDAERTVERFAGRLRDELDLSNLAGELERTSTEAVEPTHSAVWLRAGGAR